MTEQQKSVVNSWNDWDPLKHVIIGVADNCMIPPLETAVDPKIGKKEGTNFLLVN